MPARLETSLESETSAESNWRRQHQSQHLPEKNADENVTKHEAAKAVGNSSIDTDASESSGRKPGNITAAGQAIRGSDSPQPEPGSDSNHPDHST